MFPITNIRTVSASLEERYGDDDASAFVFSQQPSATRQLNGKVPMMCANSALLSVF